MTAEQWRKLKPSDTIKLQQEPFVSVSLVRKDHMNQWIGLVLQGTKPIKSTLIVNLPEYWELN